MQKPDARRLKKKAKKDRLMLKSNGESHKTSKRFLSGDKRGDSRNFKRKKYTSQASDHKKNRAETGTTFGEYFSTKTNFLLRSPVHKQ